MSYATLIKQALPTLGTSFSLDELLARVDAVAKLVPSLDELNDAFAQIQLGGEFPSHTWGPVTAQAYNDALSQNWEQLAQSLEAQGISRERQQQILAEHLRRWGRHET